MIISTLENFSIEKFFKKNLIFFSAIFLGFLLASFQLLPSLDLMLLGERATFNDTFQGSNSIFKHSSIFIIAYQKLLMVFMGPLAL